jgi:hypothetical protein
LQASQALVEEALAPLRYDLSRQVQAFADLLVGQTLSGKEDNLGAHDISIRCRIFSSDCLQELFLLAIQKESIWAIPWHTSPPFSEIKYAQDGLKMQIKYVILFMTPCT